jgi:chromosome segregation ATPase
MGREESAAMPKKRAARRDTGSAKPKELRKRLRKAEDQLQDAQTRRDRAQARVEALSIIADEIRAQLAEAEKAHERLASERDAAEAASPKSTADAAVSTKAPASTKSAAKPKSAARPKPAPVSEAPTTP